MLPSVLVNQMHLHNNDNINNKVLMWASYCLRCDCYRCDGDCYGDDGVHLLRHYHLLVLQKLVRLLSTLRKKFQLLPAKTENKLKKRDLFLKVFYRPPHMLSLEPVCLISSFEALLL